jgi:hypothetical protein
MKNKLPNLASSLVAVARRDLIAVRRMKKTYTVDMLHTWYWKPSKVVPCIVCQAGAVMARTLKAPLGAEMREPWDYDKPTSEKLLSLNTLRRGDVVGFVGKLAQREAGCASIERRFVRSIRLPDLHALSTGYVPYETSPAGYLAWLKRVEIGLRKLGI